MLRILAMTVGLVAASFLLSLAIHGLVSRPARLTVAMPNATSLERAIYVDVDSRLPRARSARR